MYASNSVYPYLSETFQITRAVLLITCIITFSSALYIKDAKVKNILYIETVITLIAGFIYSLFVLQIDQSERFKNALDWTKITDYRYIDWSLTTPLMLLTLCIILAKNSKTFVRTPIYLTIAALNYIMLLFGYLGEKNIMEKLTATIAGFVSFFIMFYLIYVKFVAPRFSKFNYMLFGIYAVFWSLYGIVYLLGEEQKTLYTNVLDMITKGFVGLSIWAYCVR